MPTLEQQPTSVQPEPEAADGGRSGWTIGRVAAVTVSVALLIMWIVVFAAAPSYHPPGWLKDRTFPKAAEKVCASYTKRLEAVPLASTARTSGQRADLVDRVTALLAERRDALEAVVPDTPDAVHIRDWLSDWKRHLADRDSYARHLRSDPGAEFLESTRGGSQISEVLDKFADDNNMASCDTFDDV
jgi:hypothetical protein